MTQAVLKSDCLVDPAVSEEYTNDEVHYVVGMYHTALNPLPGEADISAQGGRAFQKFIEIRMSKLCSI